MRKPRIQEAFEAALYGRQILLTGFGALLAYSILAFFSLPTYSSQLLGRSLTYFPEVMRMSTLGMLDTTGAIGLALTVTYSIITGVTLTNAYISLKQKSLSGIINLGAFLPGFLVAGCASCGVGLLAAFGFTGALAALPFNGNLVKLGGILVMAGLLHRSGNPKVCANPNA